jgi:putative ABC transport system permease protein
MVVLSADSQTLILKYYKMIKNYFKIFIKIAGQNKVFTILSLFGISLTIMFVMIFSMTIERVINGSGPEKDLKKMIFSDRVKTILTVEGRTGDYLWNCSRTLCEDHLKKIKSADLISMYSGTNSWEFIFNGEYHLRSQMQTDAEYWKVFDYKFVQGRPYTEEEVINKSNSAVITRSLKELLFAEDNEDNNVVGKTIRYANMDLVITGVVEDPPDVSQKAKGDLYFPYTLLPNSDEKYSGRFNVVFKAQFKRQFKAIKQEAQEIIRRLDAADQENRIILSGPFSQVEKMLAGYGDPEEYSGEWNMLLKYLLYALAFILLPAVNLMALNFARIYERGEEIAVRKSFGASTGILRGQFLFENILMTLTGGAIGIILSYILVALLGDSLSIPLGFMNYVPLSFSFNIIVFIAALVSCFLFGLFSGILPAIRLSRIRPAIYLKGGEK